MAGLGDAQYQLRGAGIARGAIGGQMMLRQSTPTQVRNPSPPNPLIRAQRLQSSLTGLGPMIATHQNHWRQPTPKPFMPPPQSQPKPPQFQWAQMHDGHWVEIRVGSQGTLPPQDRYPLDQAGARQPQMSQNKGHWPMPGLLCCA